MIKLWLILGAIGAASLFLILNHGTGSTAGVSNDEFAGIVWYGIWGLMVASALVSRRGAWRESIRNLVFWLAIFLAVTAGYLYRYELQDVGARLTAGLIPGSPVSSTSANGHAQATLFRPQRDHFTASGKVNGKSVRFVVDTGASMVVLTGNDARTIGIDTQKLDFAFPVTTANGRTTAARIRLDTVSVGAIERRNVEAMVAREGALETSLLGMSFLSTLSSLEFRGDRLVLTD